MDRKHSLNSKGLEFIKAEIKYFNQNQKQFLWDSGGL